MCEGVGSLLVSPRFSCISLIDRCTPGLNKCLLNYYIREGKEKRGVFGSSSQAQWVMESFAGFDPYPEAGRTFEEGTRDCRHTYAYCVLSIGRGPWKHRNCNQKQTHQTQGCIQGSWREWGAGREGVMGGGVGECPDGVCTGCYGSGYQRHITGCEAVITHACVRLSSEGELTGKEAPTLI